LAALKKLERADIVFLDPDTGIQTKRMTEARKKSPEYVLWREIAGYYERGQSVIVYSRRSRQEESIYRSRFDEVKKLIDKLATTHILRAPRFTTRDFLMLIQPKHTRLMDHKIKNFMESDWKEHFSQLE